MFDGAFIKRIQDALGTAEEGEALIEVARAAHRAEQELAAFMHEIEYRHYGKIVAACAKLKQSMNK